MQVPSFFYIYQKRNSHQIFWNWPEVWRISSAISAYDNFKFKVFIFLIIITVFYYNCPTCPLISCESMAGDPSFSTISMYANSSKNEPGKSLSSSSNEPLKDKKQIKLHQTWKQIMFPTHSKTECHICILSMYHIYWSSRRFVLKFCT